MDFDTRTKIWLAKKKAKVIIGEVRFYSFYKSVVEFNNT